MRYRTITLTLILLLVAGFLYGCKSKTEEEPEVDANAVAPNTVTESPASEVIVTVNGVQITEDEVEQKIQAEIEKMGAPVPERFQERLNEELRQKVLDETIVELLLDKEVEENKIVVTEQEVDRHIRLMNARNRVSMQKRALDICETRHDRAGVGRCVGNIAEIHRAQGDYDQAQEMFKRSLKIHQSLRDLSGVAACYLNLGNVHGSRGDCTTAMGFYEKALAIYDKTGNAHKMARCYENIYVAARKAGDFKILSQYIEKALTTAQQAGRSPQMWIQAAVASIRRTGIPVDEKSLKMFTTTMRRLADRFKPFAEGRRPGSKTCKKCGKPALPGMTFCTKCGEKL